MKRRYSCSIAGSGLLLLSGVLCAQTPAAKPTAAQDAKVAAAAMKECVTREQVKGNAGKEAAMLTCREQREAERLKELGPHASAETTVNSPPPPGKMSASGHSSHSGNSGTEPSNTIQESKNTVIDKPY